MSYYRSDWPEVGCQNPFSAPFFHRSDLPSAGHGIWTRQRQHVGGELRWNARQDEFESTLYGLPVWYLVLEAIDPKGVFLGTSLEKTAFEALARDDLEMLLASRPPGEGYVAAKVVPREPAHKALIRFGFEEVERRRLYTCRVGDLRLNERAPSPSGIEYTSLSGLPPSRLSSFREQILELCRRSFQDFGHGRHFTDPFLLKRRPGVEYVLAAMALNFRKVEPKHFLIALDRDVSQVCGFSAVGKKAGLAENTYTQLLTVVKEAYRGRKIYRGLTTLLSETFPRDASLLNVTQSTNREMQKAYKDSGRLHLADTVILRRVFSGANQSGNESRAQ